MTSRYQNLIVNTPKFSYVVNKLRDYCLKRGMVEAHTQNRLSILAACENPETIAVLKYAGFKTAFPQTGQMVLEHELLKNPKLGGIFCVTTSYRDEKTPIKGRHDKIFPMFEFEIHGGLDELRKFEEDMLRSVGYKGEFHGGKFGEVAKVLGTDDIKHEHEQKIYHSGKPVFFLSHFPEFTSPFWNMKRNDDGTANKIDVILSGMETIGSAERECDVDLMRNRFKTISDGEYAGLLYKKFGKKAVNDELEEFFAHKFFKRSGGGIGMSRMMNFFEKEKLYPKEVQNLSID
jgi:aspartyl/asparaginyl-tRNA synthetase